MALPRGDAQRIAKYIAKTTPTTVGLKIAGVLAQMKTGFSAATTDLVDMQLLVKAELAQIPAIPPIAYGSYYAYANELWKLQRTTSQPALDAAAQIVHDKWEDRGLATASMITIAFNVFAITVT